MHWRGGVWGLVVVLVLGLPASHAIDFYQGLPPVGTPGVPTRASVGTESGGGSGLPSDPNPCTTGQFVIDQDINGILACAQVDFSQVAGVASDAQIPPLNTLSTGLAPLRCVETDTNGLLVSAGEACGAAVTDAQVPHLNTLSTGLTPLRCVETDVSGHLVSTASACGAGGGGTVSSVFGRTGAVVAQAADYTVSQVTNAADLTAPNVFTHATGQRMKKLLLDGATSGTLTLQAPATAGSSVITLPNGTTDFSATGGTSQVVRQSSAGAPFTVSQLTSTDLSDRSSLVDTTTAQKVKNKQNVLREVVYVPDGANSITPNCDTTDVVVVNSMPANLTVKNLLGTCTGTNPEPSQEIDFRFFCSASRTITWESDYSETAGVPKLSTCTGDGTTFDYAKLRRNSVNSKFEFIATRATAKGVTTHASAAQLLCDAGVSVQCVMRNTASAGTGILIKNPSGTPNDGQLIMWVLRCTGAQTLTYEAKIIDSADITRPTACSTHAQRYTHIGARYSLSDDLWQTIAVAN